MNLRGAVQTYLTEALGIERPAMQTWLDVKRLPRYLAESYAFDTLVLWGKPLLCMMARTETPGMTELHKHLRLVELQSGFPVVLALPEMTARKRARLVELFVPFVVPGKQLFLPPLGLDLREQYAAAVRRQAPVLEPAAQAALLVGLLGGWTHGEQGANASTMARRLGYSAMSMSRAGRELLNLGFLLIEGASRTARWHLPAPANEVWRNAEPMLRSPVLRRGWAKLDRAALAGLPLAGLSALAAQSMLVSPSQPVYALGEAAWQALCEGTPGLRLEDELMTDTVCVELWCYEPRKLTPKDSLHVDPYSLALSLRDEAVADERVALAVEDLLGQIEGAQP